MNYIKSYEHLHKCQRKKAERTTRTDDLPDSYKTRIEEEDRTIFAKPVESLVQDVHQQRIKPLDVLQTYGKLAIKANARTNCLTEIMIREAEIWAQEEVNLDGPLAGVPVSLKDTIIVGGFDTSVGYSSKTGKPYVRDGALVRLLKDAGAIPFVKTNIPTTLLSFECANDVWGRTTNPYNAEYSPGGSSGGEAALLALGGSRIGIGSDVAGSVRVPAHFSGCYSLRCSTGRWPKAGIDSSTSGQEGVASVFSPMARTLGDLIYFTRSIIQMKPWEYDHSVHPIGWREAVRQEFGDRKPLRFGIMWTDGVVDPSPACRRALEIVHGALKANGHSLMTVEPPSPYDGLVLASQLLNSDGCDTVASQLQPGERSDPGAAQMRFYMLLPRAIKYAYYLYVKYIRGDSLWAGLLRNFNRKSTVELWRLVARRESYRAGWHTWWQGFSGEEKPDVLLTVPNAMPALPHGAMRDAVSSCGYTFLFNLLDYSCGVLPVTHVDKELDRLPSDFDLAGLNGIARGSYMHYNATKMDGLPVGVQVVGQKLQEEKVLAVMEVIERCLRDQQQAFTLLELEEIEKSSA